MLQTVQIGFPVGKVSSVYCAWTTGGGGPASPLIAIWIDTSMRGFEGEFTQSADVDFAELSADEPGSYLPENAAAKPEILREFER